MKIAFTVVLKKGDKTLASVEGRQMDGAHISLTDVSEKILECEAFIEKITGLRCHINPTETTDEKEQAHVEKA